MKMVLLVEDSDDDLFFIEKACKSTGVPHQLAIVRHGDEAVDYLSGNGSYTDTNRHPSPHLILLDLKMPRRDGHEVLEWIRSQSKCLNVPVIILTTSDEPDDIERAYQLGATSYLCKMSDPEQFAQAVKIIFKYWLQINIAPG